MADIASITDQVQDIHNTLVNSYRSNSEEMNLSLLKKMRLCHSKALSKFYKDLQNYDDSAPESEKLVPSIDASFLDVIHSYIRKCDNLIRANESRIDMPMDSKVKVVIRKNASGLEELSMRGMETEFINNTNVDATTKMIEDMLVHTPLYGGDIQTSEYVDNMTSSEARRYLTDSPDDIVLINYWANWCGPSNRFKPEWDRFVLEAKSKFPNLATHNVNVGEDKERLKNAKDVGVVSYPSLVLIVKGRKVVKPAGSLNAETIEQFIKDHQ